MDLRRFDMGLDLLAFWSPRELLQLVVNNGEIGAWRLLHRLVAHHVKLLLQIATMVAVCILVGPMGTFSASMTLAIGVLRQASVALIGSFAISGDAVMANMKNHAPES